MRPDEFEVLIEGRRAGLTVREYQLFAVLAGRRNRVMQRHEIYQLVWGSEMRHRDRSVDVLVRKIRGKLTACAPEWVFIHTHFGVGYRYQPEPVRPEPGGAEGPHRHELGAAPPARSRLRPLELHAG